MSLAKKVVVDSGTNDPIATARANACHAMALAFERPDRWPTDFASTLQEYLKLPAGGSAKALADVAQAVAADEALRLELSVVHARLFIGPFTIDAAPWATFYLDSEQRLMGPAGQYASRAYAEAGLGPATECCDAPDHVKLELEFMYFLAFQEASTGDDVWLSRQRRFWSEHLGLWLPQLAAAIEEASDVGQFYSELAKVTRAFCDWETLHLGLPSATSASSA